ncbi:sugar-binding transcriptional regulator [Salibacterium qingdaonense]|uniref:DNA-binding transcriptional regulator LsrR, DeoR family n=1 Tax=Salibacterium qingdaonense TaxID=266892 RepID=A0A1I4INJ1_9BACI|nr:sugar-binding transcriptional regulator [Salibacterium qingdaonense]SFL55979.1 DNA-binding transcriptional regulator LsrR, DeoR family [Salibacterium qingdaonense]
MDWKERRQMVRIAKLYHLENWTQTEIAKKVELSRPIISKLLQRAKEMGIVEIYINDETLHTVKLENEIEKKYNLKDVVVAASGTHGTEVVKRRVGQAAASYVSKKIDSLNRIGISWGKSMHAFIDEFPARAGKHVHLVPLIGGMGSNDVHLHSNHLTFHLAQKLNTTSSYLHAPAMVETEDLKNSLMQSKDIAEVIEEGRTVDLAVVGVGIPSEKATMAEMGYFSPDDIESLREAEAIGDMNSQFYNKDGMEIVHTLNNRTIALTMEDLKHIPEVVAVTDGVEKVESLHAALKSGCIDVLVTDYNMAGILLEQTF